MAIKGYFFNAILQDGVYDRVYDAEDVTSYLDMLVGDGVFPNPSTNLQVMAGTGMQVSVQAGQGWINGHKMINTAALPLTIAAANALLTRIDRVIFYVDYSARAMGIEVKTGTAAASPQAPALVRTESRYEMCLANVTVAKGATSITQANIQDTRGNSSVCGYVQGLVQQADTSTLWNQYDAAGNQMLQANQQEFDNWFDQVKETLSTATMLRKLEQVFTTTSATVSTINVTNYIPSYKYSIDILEIYIDGLRLNENEYSQTGAVVTLAVPITHAGTEVELVVYKSIDGSDAETIVEQVQEMQTTVDAIATGTYIATGTDDNKKLSTIVNAFFNGGGDYRQLEIDVYGDFAVTEPAYANGTANCTWFNFWSSDTAENTRRVKLNFEHCSRIVIDNTGFTKATAIDAANRNLEIENLQLVMNNMTTGFVFGSTTNITATDCAFWMTGIGSSSITAANQGVFTRCRFSVTNAQGAAYCVSGQGNVLQLTDCELIAYNSSSVSAESVAVHTQGNQTQNVLIMTNCSCPIKARGGYKQSNVVKINSGFYCLLGNMLGMAALKYNTGDGMTELGTMIVSK